MPGIIEARRHMPLGLPMIEVAVTIPNPPPDGTMQIAAAMVDTGADHCLLHPQIADALGLARTGRFLSVAGIGSPHGAGTSVMAALHFRGGNNSVSISPIELAVSESVTCGLLLGWQVLQHFELRFAKSGAFSLRWD